MREAKSLACASPLHQQRCTQCRLHTHGGLQASHAPSRHQPSSPAPPSTHSPTRLRLDGSGSLEDLEPPLLPDEAAISTAAAEAEAQRMRHLLLWADAPLLLPEFVWGLARCAVLAAAGQQGQPGGDALAGLLGKLQVRHVCGSTPAGRAFHLRRASLARSQPVANLPLPSHQHTACCCLLLHRRLSLRASGSCWRA